MPRQRFVPFFPFCFFVCSLQCLCFFYRPQRQRKQVNYAEAFESKSDSEEEDAAAMEDDSEDFVVDDDDSDEPFSMAGRIFVLIKYES